jgi:hypothetical protein
MPQAVSALITVPLLLTTESIDPEVAQRGSLLASSPAFFLPEDAPRALQALLSSLDVFSIWCIVLLIIGFGVSNRLSKGAAAAVVLVPWVLWIAIKVGWVALFG